MIADARLAAASSVCLDANILIYLVEGEAQHKSLVRMIWANMISQGTRVVASEFAVGECLIGAAKSGIQEIINPYECLFSAADEIELCPIDLPLIAAAARLGAAHRLKLIDAIHFQSAIASGCDIFITNDNSFRSGHGVTVLQLSDFRNIP